MEVKHFIIFIISSSNFLRVWSQSVTSNPQCEVYRNHLHLSNADDTLILECERVENDLSSQIESLPYNVRFDQIPLSIRTFSGRNIQLILRKTDETLVNENTKVWMKNNFKLDECHNSTSNLFTQFPFFKQVSFFQDIKNHAALTLAPSSNNQRLTIRGFISDNYLQFIPRRNEYVLFKISLDTYHVLQMQNDYTLETLDQGIHTLADSFDIRSCRRFIYPKLLIALDSGYLNNFNKDLTNLILHVLTYYNAVDMTFSKFKNPQIKIHISGIIIPYNTLKVPYFKRDTAENKLVVLAKNCEDDEYFLNEGKQLFSPESYDIVMQMTRSRFRNSTPNLLSVGVWSIHLSMNRRFYSSIRHPQFAGNYFVATDILNIILRNSQTDIPTLKYRHCQGSPYAWLKSDVQYLAKEFGTDDFFNRYTKPKV